MFARGDVDIADVAGAILILVTLASEFSLLLKYKRKQVNPQLLQ